MQSDDFFNGMRDGVDDYQQALGVLSVTDGLAARVIGRDAQLTHRLGGWLEIPQNEIRDRPNLMRGEAFDDNYNELENQVRRLSPEEANDMFGIPGHLAFNETVSIGEATYRQRMAQDRIFRDEVLTRSDIGPLQALGAGLAGALIDPVGLPLIFAPEALGIRGAIEGSLAARGAVRAGEAVVRSGRVANGSRGFVAGAGEGVVAGAVYEGANLSLRHVAGESDYTLGDSLANILIGGALGGALGGGMGLLRRPGAPAAVARLDEDSRLAAAALAIEDVIEDRPVRVGGLIEAQEARTRPTDAALAALDEVSFGANGPSVLLERGKLLEPSVAVTTRGTEVPVQYALVELDDLTTSHTDDLERHDGFPPELQPRDRGRTGSIARNYQLEAELNPKRLMRESGAESGAPIVSPEGVVESGNGRTIALRRSARTGSPAYDRYREELAAQGFDTTGMERPVLVRIRSQAMTGEGRQALAVEMNADVTERLSAAEQAMADAQGIDDASLQVIGEGAAAGREFARRFLARVAGDQANALVAGAGSLSAAGQQRIRAAFVAKAYGDQRLVETLFEATDNNIKAIGQALADAAPAWAQMRALAARGEIPAELDLTANLRMATDLVRWARDEGKKVHEVIAERLGQMEMFGGEAISPATEAFLRLFFRDEGFRAPRAGAKVAQGLAEYARQASNATPGPNLFGETADAGSAVEILARLNDRFSQGEAAAGDVGSLFDTGEPGDGLPGGLRPQGGGSPEGESGPVLDDPRKALPEAPAGPKPKLVTFKNHTRSATAVTPDNEVHLDFDYDVNIKDQAALQALIDEVVPSLPGGTRVHATDVGFKEPQPLLQVMFAGETKAISIGPKAAREAAAAQQAAASKAQAIIAADPELKALADDVEAYNASLIDEPPPLAEKFDPDVVAEAVRAAAFCLREG